MPYSLSPTPDLAPERVLGAPRPRPCPRTYPLPLGRPVEGTSLVVRWVRVAGDPGAYAVAVEVTDLAATGPDAVHVRALVDLEAAAARSAVSVEARILAAIVSGRWPGGGVR